MGKFTELLKTMRPKTGWQINSAGNRINVADCYDPFDQLHTAEYSPLLESKPTPTYDFIRDRLEGPGTVDNVDGEFQLDGTAGLTSLYTRRYGRYLPGLIANAGIKARPSNTGTHVFGYGNGSGNRVAMEVVNGEYKVFVESGGVRWYEATRDQWLDPLNGKGPSGLDIPDLSDAVLRIFFGHYGGLSFRFFLAFGRRSEGDFEVMIDSSGPRQGEITLEQPDLPIMAETDDVLYIGGRHFGVFGRYNPEFRVTSSGLVTRSDVSTTLIPLVSFRIKSDLKWQSVPVDLADAKVASDADGEFKMIVDGDLTAGGAALTDSDWVSVDGIADNQTAVEQNTTADNISGGYKAEAEIVTGGASNKQGDPTEDLPDINLPRDSIVTLAVQADSGTGNVFRGVLKVREEW